MILLRKRLLEKEAQVAANRAKEIEKMQAKLARQEEHARRVQERKRAMEKLMLESGGEITSNYVVIDDDDDDCESSEVGSNKKRIGGTNASTAGTGFRSTKNAGGQIIIGGKGGASKYTNVSDVDSAIGSSVNSSRGGSAASAAAEAAAALTAAATTTA